MPSESPIAQSTAAAPAGPPPPAAPEAAVSVRGLQKSYGSVRALAGVDLDVAHGTVLGLLGPNGAGKTTIIRILTTLLRPDAGSARVAGLDVVHDAARLRERIGLAGQYAAVEKNLTGRENLRMIGRPQDINVQALGGSRDEGVAVGVLPRHSLVATLRASVCQLTWMPAGQ